MVARRGGAVAGVDEPVVVVTGAPAWCAEVAAAVGGLGARLVQLAERTGYVARLADEHAALVLVDGDAEGWQGWVTTPKASPATRRIPVVLVASSSEVRQAGEAAGADIALSPAALAVRLPQLVRESARGLSPETVQALEAACGGPLPPRAREAIKLFNAGAYYRQHDLFEELWMEETGPVRELYRAILQVGVAYYQVTRGNYRGAYKVILRSLQWLNELPPVCQGVDVARLRADALRLRDALDALPDDAAPGALDASLLGKVHLVELGG